MTAYEMRISDWSLDVCSFDLIQVFSLHFTGCRPSKRRDFVRATLCRFRPGGRASGFLLSKCPVPSRTRACRTTIRSEEHTSELQSLMRISYAVFCLKKKKIQTTRHCSLNELQGSRQDPKHNKRHTKDYNQQHKSNHSYLKQLTSNTA